MLGLVVHNSSSELHSPLVLVYCHCLASILSHVNSEIMTEEKSRLSGPFLGSKAFSLSPGRRLKETAVSSHPVRLFCENSKVHPQTRLPH